MGWSGYTNYSGDDTQTRHYDFIKWSGVKVSEIEIADDEWMMLSKTKIPSKYRDTFILGIPKILKKMPKCKFWNEDRAIEWQMLLSLFLDNNIIPPKVVYDNGIEGTEYLMEEHAADFNEPSRRRKCLKNFIKRAKKLKYDKECSF